MFFKGFKIQIRIIFGSCIWSRICIRVVSLIRIRFTKFKSFLKAQNIAAEGRYAPSGDLEAQNGSLEGLQRAQIPITLMGIRIPH
jgi:hypothetical protein